MEAEARAWIEAVLGEPLGDETLHVILKSGVVLCNLINALKPGSIKKISTKKMPFMQMENISNYLAAVGPSGLGIPAFETFMTIDLYEEQNMQAVVLNVCRTRLEPQTSRLRARPQPTRHSVPRHPCRYVTHALEPRLGQIHSLGRKAQSFYEGATLGVKMSTENKREFTEEQMNAGKTTVGVFGKGSHASGQADAKANLGGGEGDAAPPPSLQKQPSMAEPACNPPAVMGRRWSSSSSV